MHRLYVRAHDTLASLVDVLLPRNVRTLRTIARSENDIPVHTASHHLLDTEITTLMDYQNPAVQDLIRSLKYDGAGHSAHICALILADFLHEDIATKKAFSPRTILLVPIPLHPNRQRERGFNQIEVILNRLPLSLRDGTTAYLAPHALVRTKNTQQQARLARSQRIMNVRNAFAVPDGTEIRDSHIFLIDDVTTTGATLISAAKTLRRLGAEVTPIALARA